jgi:hypothetical protein
MRGCRHQPVPHSAVGPPDGRRWPMRPFKGTKGTPTPRYDVRSLGNRGSPTGREAHGDGAAVVVRGRESRPHGEGRQVDRGRGEDGRRDANAPNHLDPTTGEPDDTERVTSGSEGGGGKRPTNGTSPAAYPTGTPHSAGRGRSPPWRTETAAAGRMTLPAACCPTVEAPRMNRPPPTHEYLPDPGVPFALDLWAQPAEDVRIVV